MTTLKVRIADHEEMNARTMLIARGEEKPASSDPKVWFTSTESFARVLSAVNRELLRIIAEKAPASLEELAEMTGRAGSNRSRTLKTIENYGLVRLDPGHGLKLAPKVVHDRVELALHLIPVQRRTRPWETEHEHAQPNRYCPRRPLSARLDFPAGRA